MKNRDADYFFRLGSNATLGRAKLGDTVAVKYDEVTTVKPDGQKSTKRVATAIQFLSPAQEKSEPELMSGDSKPNGSR